MRRAYTLFEMAIVLALLVLLAGLAVPSIEGMYADYKVQAAADEVRGRWASMRAHAIAEGRPYRFGYSPGRGDYRVGPESAGAADAGGPAAGDDPPLVVEDALPAGIVFGSAADGTDPDAAAVFLPDGTARADAEVVFSYPGAESLALRVRALTGGMTTRRVTANGRP